MLAQLAESVKEDWAECASAGMSWHRYAQDNMQVLCLWCSRQDLQQVLASRHDFAAVAPQVRRLVQSCAPLKNMLAGAWDQVSRSCWKDDILAKIRDFGA